MRPIVVRQTGAGSSSAVPMDHYQSPFNVGFAVVIDGTVNYTVQHTFDDVFNASVTPTWFNHPSIASQAANANGNYAFPVTALRVTVNSGSGAATLTIIQAGMPGK
jgi:hypothetical protein